MKIDGCSSDQQSRESVHGDSSNLKQQLDCFTHEARTPLNGVLGIADLLSRTKLDEQQQEYVELIKQSAESLVKMFVDLSEPSQSGEQLDAVCGKEQAGLTAEPEQIRVLVVDGLIGNCDVVDAYALAGGFRCTTVTRASDAIMYMKQAVQAGDPYSVVFAEAVLPDMDAFEFAQATRNDKSIGGIKLILVVTFETDYQREKAKRAGFDGYMARPVKQTQVAEKIKSVLHPGEKQGVVELLENKSHPGRLVLIAEDNAVNQKVALFQLRELGFAAHIVSNGKEAIEAAAKIPYAAILMDCQMPEVDGLQATQEIRNSESDLGRRVPIIAMTARAQRNDRQRCLDAGMDDYLTKPMTSDKLRAVLQRWLPEAQTIQFEPSQENLFQSNRKGGIKMFETNQQSDKNAPMQAPPFDVEALKEMLGAEETEDILKLFLETSEPLLDRIDQAIEQKDSDALKNAAHELKGSSSSIGAESLATTCKLLEMAGRTDEWTDVPSLRSGLVENFETTRIYIEALYR